jgi:hypothetical protein
MVFLREKMGQLKMTTELERIVRDLDEAEKAFPEVSKGMTDISSSSSRNADNLANKINQTTKNLKELHLFIGGSAVF